MIHQELTERGIYCDPDFLSSMGLGTDIEESEEVDEKTVSEGYELECSIADDVAAYIKQSP